MSQASRGDFETKSRPGPQAYRVVSTQGGRPRSHAAASDHRQIISLNNERSAVSDGFNVNHNTQDTSIVLGARDRFSSLIVFGFYIDFNSVSYGPITDVIIFKPYEGELEITNLEAYPLHYLKMEGQAPYGTQDDYLLQRGRRFVDSTAVSHLNYEGLSSGDEKEEVGYYSPWNV